MERGGGVVRLQVWDTAGQERFRSITTSFLRGPDGAVVVYDPTSRRTFETVSHWVVQAKDANSPPHKLHLFLVATKADLEHKWVVTEAEGAAFAKAHSMTFYVTSAKTGYQVLESFKDMCCTLPRQKVQWLHRPPGSFAPSLFPPPPSSASPRACLPPSCFPRLTLPAFSPAEDHCCAPCRDARVTRAGALSEGMPKHGPARGSSAVGTMHELDSKEEGGRCCVIG